MVRPARGILSHPAHDCRGCNLSWIVAVASEATRILLPDVQRARLKPCHSVITL